MGNTLDTQVVILNKHACAAKVITSKLQPSSQKLREPSRYVKGEGGTFARKEEHEVTKSRAVLSDELVEFP